jgi:hypothetical protein
MRRRYGVTPNWEFGDPSAKQEIAEYNSRGFRIRKAFNNKEVGIDIVQEFIESGKLKICERVVEGVRELTGYHYPEGGGNLPVKEDDHYPDALRYGLASAVLILRRRLKKKKSGRPSRSRPSRSRKRARVGMTTGG